MPIFLAVPDDTLLPHTNNISTLAEEPTPTMSKSIEGAKRADGVAYRVPPEELQDFKFSPQIARWGELDQSHVDDLARRIALEGQLTPTLTRFIPSGGIEGVGGRHRHASILQINRNLSQYNALRAEQIPPLPPIPFPGLPMLCVVRRMTDEEVTAATFSENTGKPLTSMDLAMFAHHNAKFDMPQSKIAALMSTAHHRVSASRVSTLLNLINLPRRVQTLLHTGEIPESVCQAMLKLGKSSDELEVLAGDLVAKRIKPSEITAQANEARRARGIKVRRSIADLRRLMAQLPKSKHLQVTPGELLDWLDGVSDDDVFTETQDKEETYTDGLEVESGTGSVGYEMRDGRPVLLPAD